MRPVQARTVAAVAALLLLAAATALGLSKLRSDTSPESFLPAGDPALGAMHRAARAFGGDPVVVLIETDQDNGLLDQENLPRLLRLEGELAGLPDVAMVYGPATVLNQLADSMQNMLASISGRRDLIRAQAVEAARRAGTSSPDELAAAADEGSREFDRRYGSLLARGLPAGLPTLRNARFVNRVIFGGTTTPRPQWRFVVPSPNAVAMLVRPRDGLGQRATEKLVADVRASVDRAGLDSRRVTVSGVPGVTAGLGEQLRREVPRLGLLAVGGVALCYLLLPWTRHKRDRLLPIAITLGSMGLVLATFGLLGRPLSLGVIAFLPILLGIASDFPAYLAHRQSRRQVVVVGIASAAAFASLAVSPMPFVRDLGIALAVGLLVAMLLMGLMAFRVTGISQDLPPEPDVPRTRLSPMKRGVLVALAVGVAAVGWAGLRDMAVQSEPQELAAGLPAIADAEHTERVLGATGEVQVIVRGDDVLSTQAFSWMRRAQTEIVRSHGSDLRPVLSPPTLLAFLGNRPTAAQIQAAVAVMPEYLTSAVVTPDRTQGALSFQLSMRDLGAQQELLRDVRAVLPTPPAGLQVELAGTPVAAARGYELLSSDRYLTNLAGIALAGAILLIGLRRRAVAGRAVLAAALAAGWSLAAADALGIELTPLTIALGSLTTATACEYVVMLSMASRRSAMRRTVVAAVCAATVGYLSLAASGLAALREFGWVLAGTVLLSYAAAQLVVHLLSASNPSAGVAEPEPAEREHPQEVFA